MKTLRTIAFVIATGATMASCTSTKTDLIKVYDGGVYENAAALGNNSSECSAIARSLNESVSERAIFVCVDTPK